MSVRVDIDWAKVNFELMAPPGMVHRETLAIVRGIRFAAQGATPIRSGHMNASWSNNILARVRGTTLVWRINNSAGYAQARITGVKPKSVSDPEHPMMVGATQKYGNPRIGPHRGITPALFREGYPGKPIFDIALDVVWVREGL